MHIRNLDILRALAFQLHQQIRGWSPISMHGLGMVQRHALGDCFEAGICTSRKHGKKEP
jgi:hypothetical protein